jgi:D-alanyl-D-alanine carboxypeptidase (penicillin-binding protein 5/6)
MHTTKRVLVTLAMLVAALVAADKPACAQNSVAAYVIMDAATGHVLEAKNPGGKLQIASITKIATAMVVLDWATVTRHELTEYATVPAQASDLTAGDPVGFQPGDRATVRDFLYAALMQSDNIAAVTLANYVGQNLTRPADETPEYAFIAQMNALARRLKMEHTLFLNPHGLDSMQGKLPYSTAGDVARLSAYAMAHSGFRFYVSQKEREITVQHMDGTESHYMLRNTNELLGVNSIDGVKTGTTRHAGECLVVSAARAPESVKNGDTYVITPRRLIVVVLGATNRFPVSNGLLARGWQLYDQWAAKGRPVKKDEGLVL